MKIVDRAHLNQKKSIAHVHNWTATTIEASGYITNVEPFLRLRQEIEMDIFNLFDRNSVN